VQELGADKWDREAWWNRADGGCVERFMNLTRSWMVIALALMVLAPITWSQNSALEKQTRVFLDAYAKGDQETVLELVDRENVTVYGSDVAEVVHGADALLKMMALDQQLWRGSAYIGAMEHVSVIEDKSLASMFFDAPFSVAGRPPVAVRFAVLWKREGGRWLLVQSSNAVPTEHQSAAEILHSMEGK